MPRHGMKGVAAGLRARPLQAQFTPVRHVVHVHQGGFRDERQAVRPQGGAENLGGRGLNLAHVALDVALDVLFEAEAVGSDLVPTVGERTRGRARRSARSGGGERRQGGEE